ncbi:hypothetical protein K2P97_10455 [bacterium]|nr:hypothetical protein [bacterium]
MKSLLAFALVFTGTILNAQAEIYKQDCRVVGDDDYLQFTIESDLNSKSDFALKITAFEDEACTIPYLHFNQYFKIDSMNNEQINLKTQKVTYTAVSKEVANALKMMNYCEIKNWKAGNETDVTGKMCDEFQQLAKDEIFYQIIKNNNDSVKFGSTTKALDGRTDQKRPTQFDELEYIK